MFKVLAIILAFSGISMGAARAEEVDVELLLAVDISGSMDIEEAQVQRTGYVEALKHPDFLNAVEGGYLGRIALGYFEWAGMINEDSVIAWHVIDDAEDALAFAARLQARPIGMRRATSISNAIIFGTKLIESNEFSGARRIIDISGDGPNNFGGPVTTARANSVARGIVINGLAIMIRPSVALGPLDQYYGDCVIGGAGSFVLAVHEPEDFGFAIRQKLILEVSGRTRAEHFQLAAGEAASDCLIGEKLRPGFVDPFYPELRR